MSKSLTTRLDKIENEIKILLMLQNKPEMRHFEGYSVEQKKAQKGRPKSAIDISRKLALAQQKRRRREINKLKSASSTGISRQSSSTSRSPSPLLRSPQRSPSKGSHVKHKTSSSKFRGQEKKSGKQEKKLSKHGSKKDEADPCVACCKTTENPNCCEKITSQAKINYETEKAKILQEEVSGLKELVKELNLSRTTALTVCQQWRDKYNQLKSHKCSCKQDYKNSRAERDQLIASLEAERSKLKKALADLQESEKQLQGFMGTCRKYEELLSAVRAKNKGCEDLQEENVALKGKCEGYRHEFEMMREKYEQLQHTNQTFAKDVLNRCKCFEESTAKAEENLQKLKIENEMLHANLQESKKQCDANAKIEPELIKSMKEEIECLQNSLNQREAEDAVKSKEIADLKKKLGETCDCSKLKDEVAKLTKQKSAYEREISDLHETLENISKNREADELAAMEEARKTEEDLEEMKEKLSGLQKDAKERERCATERCTNLECKLEQATMNLKETEERLLGENNELRALAEELTDIILKQKNRIAEMAGLSEKHKEIVEDQAREIECKNCELCRVEEELVELRSKFEDLEKNFRENEAAANVGSMEREIDALNKLLEDETHKLHIKEKIIEDQSSTILQLKKNLCEKDDKVAMLYKELNSLKKEVNDLNAKIAQLNEEKKSISQDCVRCHQDLDRQYVIIANLERKMILQNREWELHAELQVREKERAITAAQFASEKLMETIHDFQKQTESQNQVRNMLATLLQEKDDKLRSAILEISSLTCNPGIGGEVKKCDRVKFGRGRNETSDSNDSFASCKGPETLSSQAKSPSPSQSRYGAGFWYQVNQQNEEYNDGIEEVLPVKKGCFCSDSGPFDGRGMHLQSNLGVEVPLLKCGCVRVCRCDSESYYSE